ncbi:MAG: hypothetical protein R3C97_02890 [Geminicoccaceae bacterium]
MIAERIGEREQILRRRIDDDERRFADIGKRLGDIGFPGDDALVEKVGVSEELAGRVRIDDPEPGAGEPRIGGWRIEIGQSLAAGDRARRRRCGLREDRQRAGSPASRGWPEGGRPPRMRWIECGFS